MSAVQMQKNVSVALVKALPDHTPPEGDRHGMQPIAGFEFALYPGDVQIDRVPRDLQKITDLAGGATVRQMNEYVELPPGQGGIEHFSDRLNGCHL